MPQIDTAPNLPLIEPTPPILETPLGKLGFYALVEGEPCELSEQFGDGLPCLRRLRFEGARVDLLFFSVDPSISGQRRVDARIAAVWRVTAMQNLPSVVLRAAWESGAQIDDGGYDGGEHLMSLAWDALGVRLSVGTSDQDMLNAMANIGDLMPKRLEATYDSLIPRLVPHEDFEKNKAFVPRTVGKHEGLEVELPPLLAGESAQVHFVIAWLTGEFDFRDVSTWLAVDVDPREISRLAEEAVAHKIDVSVIGTNASVSLPRCTPLN
jgi:hypothetical protein